MKSELRDSGVITVFETFVPSFSLNVSPSRTSKVDFKVTEYNGLLKLSITCSPGSFNVCDSCLLLCYRFQNSDILRL